MIPEDIDNILRAIKAGNWSYVVRWMPRLKHDEQFILMNALSAGLLEDLHHFLSERAKYLNNDALEVAYSSTAAVTVLRQRGIYSDSSKEDEDRPEKVKTIEDLLVKHGLYRGEHE